MVVIKNNNEEEIVEKKSRFIANLIYVENEEEAINKIKEIKKKYYDARHNCYAYRVMEGETIIQRSSDDGEPSGTAGAPMLNIIEKNDIINVLVVVTRYFGGILLGTGGLVKAYSDALQKAVNSNELLDMEMGYEAEIKASYSTLKNLEYFLRSNNIKILKQEYLEEIKFLVEITSEKIKKLNEKFPKNIFDNFEIKIEKEKIISKNGEN